MEFESERRFPLLGVKSLTASGREVDASIPWALIQEHRQQARRNHGRSLEILARHGGLTVQELAAVLCDRGPNYAQALTEEQALIIVHRVVENYARAMIESKSS